MKTEIRPKTIKVMDTILDDGTYIVCIRDNTLKFNPFRVFVKWWDQGSWHRKQLVTYADMKSVVYFLKDIVDGRVRI